MIYTLLLNAPRILDKETIFDKYRTDINTISGKKNVHMLHSVNTPIPNKNPYSAATAFPPLKPANKG